MNTFRGVTNAVGSVASVVSLETQERRIEMNGISAGFTISGDQLHDAANPHAALRRDRKRREAANRERVERSKELGEDAMSLEDFATAVEFVRDKFGIVLRPAWGSLFARPNFTARELFALCVNGSAASGSPAGVTIIDGIDSGTARFRFPARWGRERWRDRRSNIRD